MMKKKKIIGEYKNRLLEKNVTNIFSSGKAALSTRSESGNWPNLTGTKAAGANDLLPGIITPDDLSISCLKTEEINY